MNEVGWNSASGARDVWERPQMQGLGIDERPTDATREMRIRPGELDKGRDMDAPQLQTRKLSAASPRLIPVPEFPNLSNQLPSSPPLSIQLPPPVSSFDKSCAPAQAP